MGKNVPGTAFFADGVRTLGLGQHPRKRSPRREVEQRHPVPLFPIPLIRNVVREAVEGTVAEPMVIVEKAEARGLTGNG